MPKGIFQFYVLRGRRTKGLKRRPFVNCRLGNRSWDSALRPQTNSGLPAFISLGRDEVGYKSVQIVRSVVTAGTKLLFFRG